MKIQLDKKSFLVVLETDLWYFDRKPYVTHDALKLIAR